MWGGLWVCVGGKGASHCPACCAACARLQDAMAALRQQLTEDEWDVLQQVTSSASYFV